MPPTENVDRGDRATTRLLVDLAGRDLALRTELAGSGELHDGYHPRMAALHEANAAALDALLEDGWPGIDRVGEDGEQAAWLIAQHAIGLPEFMRRCRGLLAAAVERDTAPAWQLALMTDRILGFEGHPQIYGTQFDWDEDGELSPLPIEDAEHVDARRAAVGLEPIAKATARHRENAVAAGATPPADGIARRAEGDDWARRVGWR